MGKYVNLFIGTIVVIFIVVVVGGFVYSMIVNPIEVPKDTENEIQRELPESCDGVLSTETWLYPTAEECMTFLYLDLYAPCMDLSLDESNVCMDKIDYALDQNCRTVEKTLGVDYEVCVMDTLKRLYQE